MFSELYRYLLLLWGFTGLSPLRYYQALLYFSQLYADTVSRLANLPNGSQMNCNLKDYIQVQIYFVGLYEPVESYFFTRLLEPGMTVIDIGANVGQYTLLAAQGVGGKGRVHSFEPIPQTFVQLRNNIYLNHVQNVCLNQVALWDKSELLELSLPQGMTNNGGAYSIGCYTSETLVRSAAIALDDYVKEQKIEKVDLIKMDIEGAEIQAILGASQTLKRDHPILLLELNRITLERFNYKAEELWSLLTKDFEYEGYVFQVGPFKRVSFRKLKVEDIQEIQQANVLLIHSETKTPDFIDKTWNYRDILRWARRCKYPNKLIGKLIS